jgi:hypothetical protein
MDNSDVRKNAQAAASCHLDAEYRNSADGIFRKRRGYSKSASSRGISSSKQKFEPGTVGSKIESSLHNPAVVKKEQLKASAAKAKLEKEMEEVLGASETKKPAPPPEPEPAAAVAAAREPRLAPGPAPRRTVVREARPKEIPAVAVEEAWTEPEEPAPAGVVEVP